MHFHPTNHVIKLYKKRHVTWYIAGNKIHEPQCVLTPYIFQDIQWILRTKKFTLLTVPRHWYPFLQLWSSKLSPIQKYSVMNSLSPVNPISTISFCIGFSALLWQHSSCSVSCDGFRQVSSQRTYNLWNTLETHVIFQIPLHNKYLCMMYSIH